MSTHNISLLESLEQVFEQNKDLIQKSLNSFLTAKTTTPSQPVDLFANADNNTTVDLFANADSEEVDLFANATPNLFANAPEQVPVYEVCPCYVDDTEGEDEAADIDTILHNLEIVADQLEGRGQYTLADIVRSVSELV